MAETFVAFDETLSAKEAQIARRAYEVGRFHVLRDLHAASRFEQTLMSLRANGWRVAVHNDYRQDGDDFTFWLFTHDCGLYLKGEGKTDAEALDQIAEQARKIFAPSPMKRMYK